MLVAGALLLTGCGVPREPVDVTTTDPNGMWQSIVVWPLAKSLIWLHGLMEDFGVPYHWGFAIIVFTLLVKLVTLPLTLTQIRGMEAQKRVQPKLQELQKKYGKDRERMAQEQMKLYREEGVNPLSGCLPLIVQMPILFGLYSALVVLSPALQDSDFFWIPNLNFPEYHLGLSWLGEAFSAGDYGTLGAYLVLPVLLMGSQFISQRWMTPMATPAPKGDGKGPDQANMMRQVTYLMTFMFGFFTLQVPAALSLYWVTSNLLQMLQQWLIMGGKLGGATPALATAGAGAGGVSASLNGTSSNGSVDAADNSSGNVTVVDGSATVSSGNKSKSKSKSKQSNRRRAKKRK